MAVYGREHYKCTYKGVALEQGGTPGYRRARRAGCQPTDRRITGSEGNIKSRQHYQSIPKHAILAMLTKFRENRIFWFGIAAYE